MTLPAEHETSLFSSSGESSSGGYQQQQQEHQHQHQHQHQQQQQEQYQPSASDDAVPPPHFIGSAANPDADAHSQSLHDGKWTKDDVVLAIALPIILAVLFGVALRHCYVSSQRHAQLHARRQSARARHREYEREMTMLGERREKERTREIEGALITKVASKCKCKSALSTKKCISMSDLTTHTNLTEEMSMSSSSHDVENPMGEGDPSASAGEMACAQTCAICLEPYVAGEDKVSWSKFQTCRHAFHASCILGWLAEEKRNCPCCRGPYLKEIKGNDHSVSAPTSTDEESNAVEAWLDDNETVQTLDGGGGVDAEAAQSDADERSPDDSNENVHIPNEEGSSDGGRPRNTNAQTSDEDDDLVATSVQEGSATAIGGEELAETANIVTGSEFTSFCTVHGLRRDTKKRTGGAFSFKYLDDTIGVDV